MQSSDRHLCINALAGCGKTYTLKKICSMECMEDKSILYLVFNKKNQLEARETFSELPNVEALTTHKFLGDIVKK